MYYDYLFLSVLDLNSFTDFLIPLQCFEYYTGVFGWPTLGTNHNPCTQSVCQCHEHGDEKWGMSNLFLCIDD